MTRGQLVLASVLFGAGCKASVPTTSRAPEPRADLTAVQRRVVDEVVAWKTLDHDVVVYALPRKLTAGSTLGGAGRHDVGQPVGEDSWLFVIDDAPDRLLEHPMRHVLVGERSGSLTIRQASNWPVVDARPVFSTSLTELSREAIYSTFRGKVAALPPFVAPKDVLLRTPQRHVSCASGRAPRRYAVIGTGNGTGEDLLAATGHAMWVTLAGMGFDVLHGAWGSKDPGAGERFMLALAGLSSQVECCDEVLVYINAHGARRVMRKDASGNSVGLFYGEDGQVYDNGRSVGPASPNDTVSWDVRLGTRYVTENELAEALRALKACHITVVIEACFSGGFQAALATVPGVERVFTSAASDEASEADLGLPSCPATHYLLRNVSVAGVKDVGEALHKAWDAGVTENPFAQKPNTTWAAANLTFERPKTDRPTQSQRTTDCVCCGDGKLSAGELCDPKAAPSGCPDGGSCSTECDSCSAPKPCPDVVCSPACETGFTCCSGRCVELRPKIPNYNPDNQAQTLYCGSCGNACTLAEYCDTDGSCKPFYTGDASYCSDAKACTTYWASAHLPPWWNMPAPEAPADCTALMPVGGWSCIGGSCCGPGQTAACTANLEPPAPCKANETVCAFPSWHPKACFKACVDLLVGTGNPTLGVIHCGKCGALCRRGEFCVGGKCVSPSASPTCDVHWVVGTPTFTACTPTQRCCPVDTLATDGRVFYTYKCL